MLPEKMFVNIFADPDITNFRLSAFTTGTLSRIARLDTGGRYTALKDAITRAAKAFQDGISGIDQSLNQRKGKTGIVDAVAGSFKHAMSELQGAIAHAVGGFDSEAYVAFYPHGVSEYWLASKTAIPTLLDRVFLAAEVHGDRLGDDLKGRLQGFKAAWSEARGHQSQAKGAVSGRRAQRGSARYNLEISLLMLVHTIACDFAGDEAAGRAWFDFSLLEPSAHPSLRKGHNGGSAGGGSNAES